LRSICSNEVTGIQNGPTMQFPIANFLNANFVTEKRKQNLKTKHILYCVSLSYDQDLLKTLVI